jgi:putative lipoprotein
MRLILPLLLLPICLNAIADGERQRYSCDNGSHIEIGFTTAADGLPMATLYFADDAITLPQVPSASGAFYRNEVIRLRTKGDEVFFEDEKANRRHCLRGEIAPVSTIAATPATSSKPSATSSFIDIVGSVSYRQRIALPPDAVLVVRVQDFPSANGQPRTLAEQRIELAGQQVPIPFQTTIDRDLIGKRPHVTVTARIERHGKTLFRSEQNYPALKKGQPQQVDILLRPAQSPQKH